MSGGALGASSSHPQSMEILLNIHAYPGSSSHRNATTARDSGRNRQTIEVSFYPSTPPLPSILFIGSPDLENPSSAFTVLPRIIRAVEDLILLRVDIDHVSSSSSLSREEDCDYFIYRADTKSPSLKLLPGPYPFCSDDDVGLVRRDSENYTVAALVPSSTPNVYELHRFHSWVGRWSIRRLSVGEPQRGFPIQIPRRSGRLLYHNTSTVIAIGGEYGTMGWVDLWRGILLCDVFVDEPTLRGVPLPLPLELVTCNNGQGVELGCPKSLRGIAVIKTSDGTPCLKLAHLELDTIELPGIIDEETELPSFIMRGWAITTWSNTMMTSSWKDWHRDRRVQSSDITIDNKLNSGLLRSGLLCEQQHSEAKEERALRNVLVSHPTPCCIGTVREDIVYLMARVKFLHPKAWALAVDMTNKKLLAAAEFGTERQTGDPAIYCPTTISKSTNLGAFLGTNNWSNAQRS
uniref:DUF1618 domain-containing protein n=1 Tax=Leersia perrieri TaxID=77586 RepID=A0A0D9WLW5_9ORYZ